MAYELPEILDIPEKLLPILFKIKNYDYFLAEGGRSSGKTQSIARILLFLAEQNEDLRIVCGREVQNTIDESVHAVFSDLIRDYNLAFNVIKTEIKHKLTGSVIKFKGFREQGRVNIKGLEGVDILWIDEGQSITKPTLDVIIPTIRKNGSKVLFSMNRHTLDDAVFTEFASRIDCLHVTINYYDNHHNSEKILKEAELCKKNSERDYNHIWLGLPLASSDDYLFNTDFLYKSLKQQAFGELYKKQRVIGIDFAAQGNDRCVATILDRLTGQHWEINQQIAWDEPDSMASVGRIVSIIGQFKPDLTCLDVGGMGTVVHSRLVELGLNVVRFDGATTDGVRKDYFNKRADGYYYLKEWFESGFLCLKEQDKPVIKELEKIKMKYRSDGKRLIQSKLDMKKELRFSPDLADSLMMSVWLICNALGKVGFVEKADKSFFEIKRKDGAKRKFL